MSIYKAKALSIFSPNLKFHLTPIKRTIYALIIRLFGKKRNFISNLVIIKTWTGEGNSAMRSG